MGEVLQYAVTTKLLTYVADISNVRDWLNWACLGQVDAQVAHVAVQEA